VIDIFELEQEIRSNISNASANAPRSKQRSIGPSEVGGECDRKLGYRLLGVEPVNQSDTWLATIGTAVHAWLAEQYEKLEDAERHDNIESRYLIEHPVFVTDTLSGSVDLVDLKRKLVIDWKVVGDTSLKKYKKEGVGDQYRTQAHLYAYGLIRGGRDIRDVAIVFLPRGGSLKNMYIWSEPFNLGIAQRGIERLKAANYIIDNAGVDALSLMNAVSSFCHYCPFYLPGSTEFSVGCPGGDLPNPTQLNMERR